MTNIDFRPSLFPVKDQGNMPACTSYAFTAANEYLRQDEIVLSEGFLYYAGKVIKGATNYFEGLSFTNAAMALSRNGQCEEQYYSFRTNFPNVPDRIAYNDALNYVISSCDYVSMDKVARTMDILRSGNLCIISIQIFNSFFRNNSGIIILPNPNENPSGIHAVCVVGYLHDSENTPHEYFIIRNSWGASWGDNGYGYLPFLYLENHSIDIGEIHA